jgi:hypothetical protein
VGSQAFGDSHACHQHSPSRVCNAGTTTANVDGHAGNTSKISGHPRHHWGRLDWGVPICIPFGQQFGYWRLRCSHLHSIQPAIWVLETGVFPSAFHSASNLGSGTHLHSIQPAIWVLVTGVFPSAFHSASNLGTGDWGVGVPICIPFSQQFGYWRLGCSHLHSIQPAIWVLETGVFPSAFHSASNLGTGLGCSHLHSIRPAIWVLVPICIPFSQQFSCVIAPCIGGRVGRGRDGPVRPQ